tara:strand:- start:734 stop:949 length:216 start_codon:yes stop_codon:yes gene_type:complete
MFKETNINCKTMSLLTETKRVLLKKDTGIVSFINKEGNSTHVLYIQKPRMIKDKDFREIMESLDIRFKKKL